MTFSLYGHSTFQSLALPLLMELYGRNFMELYVLGKSSGTLYNFIMWNGTTVMYANNLPMVVTRQCNGRRLNWRMQFVRPTHCSTGLEHSSYLRSDHK